MNTKNAMMRCFLLAAALLICLGTHSSAAPKSDQTPGAGEIALTGHVLTRNNSSHTLVIAAEAVTLPDGTTTHFQSARRKTIILTAQTRIITAVSVTRTLANLRGGIPVTVVGQDSGVGQPMTARVVLVEKGSASSSPGSSGSAGVNARDTDGQMTLIQAAENGRVQRVRALIAAGADVNEMDRWGRTALMLAADNPFPPAWGFDKGCLACIGVLVAAHADVNAMDKNGYTALIGAAGAGKVERVKALLAAGADVNKGQGTTALTMAAEEGNTATVKALLAAGADINLDGMALINAAMVGNVESVKVLLAAGADVNAKDSRGETALTLALAKNHPAVVAILQAAGATE